ARRRRARGEQSAHGDRRPRRKPAGRPRVRGGAAQRDDPDPASGPPRHETAARAAAIRARDRPRRDERQSQRRGAWGARSRVVSLPLAPASAPDSAMPTAIAASPALAPSSPPSESPSGGGASAQAPAGSLAGLRVLIVEDEEAVRRPMARYLTRRGAEVDEAADGVEGLARLRTQPANVILADLRMPRMGGVELYAQLEEERPELAARVLFLSGDVSQLAQPGNTPVPRE